MPMTYAQEAKILDHQFGLSAYSPVESTLYLAAFTTAPDKTGGGVEVAGAGYARVSITNTSASWVRSGSVVRNKITFDFPKATADYPADIVAVGLFDSSSGGVLTHFAEVPAYTVLDGKTFFIDIDQFIAMLGG